MITKQSGENDFITFEVKRRPALVGFSAGSIAQNTDTIVTPEKKAPVILATIPTGGEMNVDLDSVIDITFNSVMDDKSINDHLSKILDYRLFTL